jgi:predicted nucleotidyltransferase
LRIKEKHIEEIKHASREYFGENAKVYLFGSRTDDNKKGGDIDLYIETHEAGNIIERKIKLLGKLNTILGEQKIDIIINNFESEQYIFKIARNQGILL